MYRLLTPSNNNDCADFTVYVEIPKMVWKRLSIQVYINKLLTRKKIK